MRTIIEETTLYTFEELTEEAQEKAIEGNCYINVEYVDWWDLMYEDAERIGLKITSFDLDRYRHAKGKFLWSALECAESILKEHGENTTTYQTAKEYLADRAALVAKYSDGINLEIVNEDNEYDFDDECDELDQEFLRSLLEDYSILLQNEYEYLTSEEAIKEIFIANEYEFTIDGKLY